MKVWSALLCALLLSGCSKQAVEPPGALEGQAAKPGSMVAYEHALLIEASADHIKPQMQTVRQACALNRFGPCTLIRFEQTSGRHPSGLIELRAAPVSVQPIVELAGSGGAVRSQTTRGEDLAQSAADSSLQRNLLLTHRTMLLELQGRKDLAVGDLLSLSRELASVSAQLEALDRQDGVVQRRVESNLLTIRYVTVSNDCTFSRLGDSLLEASDSLLEGASEAIELAAHGAPFLILAFPVALLWRWLWRRLTRDRPQQSP